MCAHPRSVLPFASCTASSVDVWLCCVLVTTCVALLCLPPRATRPSFWGVLRKWCGPCLSIECRLALTCCAAGFAQEEEAREEAVELFKEIDADGNGFVSKSELRIAMSARVSDPTTQPLTLC